MPTVTSSMIGVNLARVDASSAQMYPLGTQVLSTDGGLFEYVTCLSIISQYNAVVISEIGQVSNLTSTNGGPTGIGKKLAVAQVSIPVSSYGWVQRQGVMVVNVLADCQDIVPLFTTATPGKLDDVTVSECMVLGLNTVSSTSTASAVTAIGAAPLQIFPFANPA